MKINFLKITFSVKNHVKTRAILGFVLQQSDIFLKSYIQIQKVNFCIEYKFLRNKTKQNKSQCYEIFVRQ